MRVRAIATVGMAASLAGLWCSSSDAQSMTPMRGQVYSSSDEFAVKVFPRNVYDHRIDFEVHVYDEAFQPIDAVVWPQSFSVGAGGTRPVTVLVKFGQDTEKKVRVCAESVPYPDGQTQIKARICGRFLGHRLQ